MGCVPSTTTHNPNPVPKYGPPSVMSTSTQKSEVSEEDVKAAFPLSLIGGKSCGKSCLLARIITNKWEESPSLEETTKFLFKDQGEVVTKSQLTNAEWMRSNIVEITERGVKDDYLRSEQTRHLKGIIVVFDLNNQESFDHVAHFKTDKIRDYTYYSKIPKFLLGLKSDLGVTVKTEDIDKLLETLVPITGEDEKSDGDNFNWRYYQVSAKDGTQIKEFLSDLKRGLDEIS